MLDLVPIVISAVFGAAFFIAPWFVCKGENKGIIQVCIMLTAFCMWIFYITVYIAQMNPLIGPRLDKHSLVWLSAKWGDAPNVPKQ